MTTTECIKCGEKFYAGQTIFKAYLGGATVFFCSRDCALRWMKDCLSKATVGVI